MLSTFYVKLITNVVQQIGCHLGKILVIGFIKITNNNNKHVIIAVDCVMHTLNVPQTFREEKIRVQEFSIQFIQPFAIL